MGVCYSCLGISRKRHDAESSRLLDSDDPYSQYANYGGTGSGPQAQQYGGNQLDPEEARKEREALDGITKWTSDTVVDIWTRQPRASIIPGDKDHKARIYPSSRPQSQESNSSFGVSSHIKHTDGVSKLKVDELPLVRTLNINF